MTHSLTRFSPSPALLSTFPFHGQNSKVAEYKHGTEECLLLGVPVLLMASCLPVLATLNSEFVKPPALTTSAYFVCVFLSPFSLISLILSAS